MWFSTEATLPVYFSGQCDTSLPAMESYIDVTHSSTSFVLFHPLSALRISSIEQYRPNVGSFNRGKNTQKSWAVSNTKALLNAVVHLSIVRPNKAFSVK